MTRCDTFTVRGILYSALSRLIGHRLTLRVYADHLDCYLSGALVHNTARGSHAANSRRRKLDYRHFIEALKRTPTLLRVPAMP
ncbi:integrase catalytic region [Caballeronia temeraria]|uniref:Integrase catalytic region n=1 Tax=Caballeronia temeraria TaxID=1777137 RepID=A0A158DD72_9BURK|nr:integrase catalytic region [Caballeronia temeraria]